MLSKVMVILKLHLTNKMVAKYACIILVLFKRFILEFCNIRIQCIVVVNLSVSKTKTYKNRTTKLMVLKKHASSLA